MINGIDTHGSAEDIAAITGYIDGEQKLKYLFSVSWCNPKMY